MKTLCSLLTALMMIMSTTGISFAKSKSFKNENIKTTKNTSTSVQAKGTIYVRVRAYVNKTWQAYSSTRQIKLKTSQSKILVAYYTGTGNTARVAKEIARALKADTFVITPEKKYTEADLDWTNDRSRVNKEHNSTKLQNSVALRSTKPAHFSSYKTV